MPQRRSPRTLRDVSYLFLSGGESTAARAARRSEAVIWIAAVGSSVNRAHLAAGTAVACAKEGMQVSLMEVSRSLPNVGYYFSMEPVDYLTPAIDRSRLVSGLWGDGVRCCFSAKLSSFLRYTGEALQQDASHAVVAAFSYPASAVAARFCAELRIAVAALSDRSGRGECVPDCIIIAADGPNAARARGLLSDLRAIFPHAVFFFMASGSDCGRAIDADESLLLPKELRCSWARRMPPGDHFFSELATSIFQILSLRRRRAVGHAANG
jgi:hypothetical protein